MTSFNLVSLTTSDFLILLAITALPPIVIISYVLLRANGITRWIRWTLHGALILVVALDGYIYSVCSNSTVGIDHNKIEIPNLIYGLDVPIRRVENWEIVDLQKRVDIEPQIRTNGIGFPGCNIGWHRLRNGERAYLFLTNRNKVIYISTIDDYSILLSVDDHQKFIEQLNNIKS